MFIVLDRHDAAWYGAPQFSEQLRSANWFFLNPFFLLPQEYTAVKATKILALLGLLGGMSVAGFALLKYVERDALMIVLYVAAALMGWLAIGALFGSFVDPLSGWMRQCGETFAARCRDLANHARAQLWKPLEFIKDHAENAFDAIWPSPNAPGIFVQKDDHQKEIEVETPEPESGNAPMLQASAYGDRLPDIVGVLTLLVLAIFVVANGYLLYKIFPDMFALSPKFMKSGVGKVFGLIFPLAFLSGEVICGILIKMGRRRKQVLAGASEGTLTGLWVVFLLCCSLEVLGGARRAYSYLEVPALFGSGGTQLLFTVDSVTGALMWVVLAFAMPIIIFQMSAYIEPMLYGRLPIGGFFRGLGRAIAWVFRYVIAHMGFAFASVVVFILALAAGLIVIVFELVRWASALVIDAIGFIEEVLVLPLLDTVLFVTLRAPHRLSRWGGATVRSAWASPATSSTSASLLILMMSAGMGAGCQQPVAERGGNVEATFPVIAESEVKPPIPPAGYYDDVPRVKFVEFVSKHHPIVRVREPATLHVCIADLSLSVRSAALRQATLEQCARAVSDVSARHDASTIGVVLPIVDSGRTSNIPMERLEGLVAPKRCITNPPIPDISSDSSDLAIRHMESIKGRYGQMLSRCQEAVQGDWKIARAKRIKQQPAFIARVHDAFSSLAFSYTDVYGTLASVAEVARRERLRSGLEIDRVIISIVSDLIDDANTCDGESVQPFVDDEAIPIVPACPPVELYQTVRAFLRDPSVHVEIHQVREVVRGVRAGWSATQRERQEELDMWRDHWVAVASKPDESAGRVRAFTFSAPAVVRASAKQAATRKARPRATAKAHSSSRSSVAKTSGDSVQITSTSTSCRWGGYLRTNRHAMAVRRMSVHAWTTFGLRLHACGPDTKPWNSVGLPDQDAFVRKFITPYINGDQLMEQVFFRTESGRYRAMVRAWGLSG
jgi:hypothetical protein